MPREIARLAVPLELRFDDAQPDGVLSGYASVFGRVNTYGDLVAKGAFRQTLRDWKARKRLPPMLLQHGMGAFLGGDATDMVPVGVWTEMSEDEAGLKVEGRLIAMDTERGRTVYAALKEGAMDGISIGFTAKEWSVGTKAEEPRRTLKAIELWEASLVTFPADDAARVREVRAEHLTKRQAELALRDAGFSRREALAIVAEGFDGIAALRDAGDETDGLADLLRAGAAIWRT